MNVVYCSQTNKGRKRMLLVWDWVHMYAVLLFCASSCFCKPPHCPPCQPMQLISALGTSWLSWLCHRHGNTRITLLRASLPVSAPSPPRHLENHVEFVCFVCAAVFMSAALRMMHTWVCVSMQGWKNMQYILPHTHQKRLSVCGHPHCYDLCMAP